MIRYEGYHNISGKVVLVEWRPCIGITGESGWTWKALAFQTVGPFDSAREAYLDAQNFLALCEA